MRILAVILSVIFLSMSFMPCSDNNQIVPEEIPVLTIDFPQQNQNQHSDDCSPLCICSCCSTTVAQIEPNLPTSDVLNEFNSEKTGFILSAVSPLYFSIWEPPKIV